MKIRDLVVLAITIALGMLCAPAQERNGPVTFTDDSNQSITLSRFGTVLSFKNNNGKETVPGNSYRVCPCGEKGPCIESATDPSEETSSNLEVRFPKRGTTLKRGQTLVVTVTFRQGELIVRRRLTWVAGSSTVKTDDAISALKPLCFCTFEEKLEKTFIQVEKMCPRPPGYLPCPPESQLSPEPVRQTMKFTNNYDYSKL